MAEPGFVMEVMPYIGVLQVIVYIGDGPPQNLKLNLRPRELELTFTNPEAGPEGYKLALNLPQEVKTDNAVLTRVGSHLIARISLAQKLSEQESEEISPIPPLLQFQGAECR